MPTVPYPGLPFSRGIQPTNKGPVDAYIGPYGHNSTSYGPAAGSTGAGICLANDTIAPILRYVGQSVIIHGWSASEGATYAYLYWYRGGTADDDLELFSAGSASTSSGVTLAVAGAGIVLSPAEGTGTVTFINNGVLSFNGNTGAVTGASLGANTFTASQTISGSSASLTVTNTNNSSTSEYTSSGINVSIGPASQTIVYSSNVPGNTVTFPAYTTTLAGLAGDQTFSGGNTFSALSKFTAGITTAFIYASTGSTFAGTLKVVGGATFDARVDVGGVLQVAGGVTLEQTLNVISVAKFHSNVSLGDETADSITATGTFLGLTSSGRIIANAGITTAFIYASTGSTFGARVDIAGILDVVGGVTLENTLDVGGVARFALGSTFSGIAAFTSGVTTSSIYASTGSTFGARVDVAGVLDVVGGVTLENTLDVGGVARFTTGITTSTLNASAAIRANGGLTASTLDVEGVSKFAGGATFSSSADFASAARFAVGLTSSGDVVVGSAGTVLKTNGDATIGATLTVNGNFFVAGTLTTVNRTDLAIDDKTITLGRTLDNDALADGGGLSLRGTSPRTLTWSNDADAWQSNDNFNVPDTYGYKVNNTTALASGMVHGLSASAGTITGGTWAANSIGLTYGGTNKNLAAVGSSGGIVFKDGTGLSITSSGSHNQVLMGGHQNVGGLPQFVNTTSLTGLTADRVKTNDTNSGIYYLTFVAGVCASTDLLVDTAAGVTYDAGSGVLSCVQLEALVDGGTF